MEKSYSIEEILLAVNDLQNKKGKRVIKVNETRSFKKDESAIPKDTLRLIEQAENKE